MRDPFKEALADKALFFIGMTCTLFLLAVIVMVSCGGLMLLFGGIISLPPDAADPVLIVMVSPVMIVLSGIPLLIMFRPRRDKPVSDEEFEKLLFLSHLARFEVDE